MINVEVDVLARYIERLLTAGAKQQNAISLDWLKENGF